MPDRTYGGLTEAQLRDPNRFDESKAKAVPDLLDHIAELEKRHANLTEYARQEDEVHGKALDRLNGLIGPPPTRCIFDAIDGVEKRIRDLKSQAEVWESVAKNYERGRDEDLAAAGKRIAQLERDRQTKLEERLVGQNAELEAQNARLREALEASKCRCSRALVTVCRECGGELVAGVEQFADSWICPTCKETKTPESCVYQVCDRCAVLAESPAANLESIRAEAGRERAAKELRELANLIQQTTPPRTSQRDDFGSGVERGRERAIEQIETRADEIEREGRP